MGSLKIPIGPNPVVRVSPFGFRVPHRSAEDLLYFPPETLAVVTPFRRQVLNYIHRTANGLARGTLDSADISISGMPDEEDGTAIDLIMIVNGDWEAAEELRSGVLDKVAEWSKEWSMEQQRDYGEWIFVSVEPRCA